MLFHVLNRGVGRAALFSAGGPDSLSIGVPSGTRGDSCSGSASCGFAALIDELSGPPAFIAEWSRRGYATPRGGWARYDIHHIQPLEFGGTNDFWNLVPVERGTHSRLFNDFWRLFEGL